MFYIEASEIKQIFWTLRFIFICGGSVRSLVWKKDINYYFDSKRSFRWKESAI